MSAGRIVIRRPRALWFDALRAYRIVIDGIEVGKLRQGGKIVLEHAPGTAVIGARIDWCSAPPLRVEIRPGEDCVVEVANAKGLEGLRAEIELRDPGNYLRLTLVSGQGVLPGPWG